MTIGTGRLIPAVLWLVAAVAAGGAGPAAAHEFTVAIVGGGSTAAAQVADVVRGFVVATDERDGHANETSDGHLGGIDVQIRVLPAAAAAGIDALVGSPRDPADVALVLDPEAQATAGATAIGPDTIVFAPGTLPPRNSRDASGFAARFRALHGAAPTEAAERGYNAARRIDGAIRRAGGLAPRAAVEAALADTATGTDW